MIHFMLNNLRSPTCEVLCVSFHLKGLKLYFNCFISLAFAWTAEKRQTAFFSIISAILLDNLGIEHHRVCRSSSALVKKGDNALAHTDHISCHADTTFSMCHQRIKQILCDLQIFFRCDLRLPCKGDGIVYKFFNHRLNPFSKHRITPHVLVWTEYTYVRSHLVHYQPFYTSYLLAYPSHQGYNHQDNLSKSTTL